MRTSRNVRYVLVDVATGFVKKHVSVPPQIFAEQEPAADQRIVVPADGIIPAGQLKLDMRKVRKPINHVASIDAVRSAWRPAELPDAHSFEIAKQRAISDLDERYAKSIDDLRGPLALLHTEKRRQAEAGGGPLVADEADRVAILANAAAQDEAVAAIERERREKKALIRAATTEDEIRAALAVTGDDPKAI